MRLFRVSLWMYGLCVIRSQPIDGQNVDARSGSWRYVFGDKADIRVQEEALHP